MNRKLRVGLLLDSLDVPSWVREMVRRIVGSRFATIELVVVREERRRSARRIPERPSRAVLASYVELERRLLGAPPDAFERAEIRDLIGETAVLRVRPLDDEPADCYPEEAISAIRSKDLDVLCQVGCHPLRGEILHVARFGTWGFQHGDHEGHRDPAGVREVVERIPVTGSTLRVLSEERDGGAVLYRSCSPTSWSVTRNRNALYWKTLAFLPRKLEELWSLGPEELGRRASGLPLTLPPRHEGGGLGGRAVFSLVLRLLSLTVRDRLVREQWVLLYADREGDSPALTDFKELLPPDDRFWADPHVLARDGKHYVFLEELPYATDRGHISVMVLDREGRWSGPTPVLEEPYHLSNPFVFEWKGDLFMIPESAAHRTVDLYRCERFPDRWARVRTLLRDVRAVDTTLFPHQGRWWMFVNMAEHPGASTWDELFLFHATDPVSGEWSPHPRNPVVSDVRRARPAGPLFVKDGILIRPAQDCSSRYGYAVRFMRVDRLDEEEYAEAEIGCIEPTWDRRYVGIHTYDRVGSLTVVDAIRPRWRMG